MKQVENSVENPVSPASLPNQISSSAEDGNPERLALTINQLYEITERPEQWSSLVASLLDLLENTQSLGSEATADESAMMRWLTPHLGRVLQQQAVIIQQQNMLDFQGALLDRHPLGLALCKQSGQVAWANAKMQAYLEGMSPTALACVQECIRRGDQLPQVVMAGQDEITITASAMPSAGVGYVVLMASSAHSMTLESGTLRDLYGLTPTEGKIAQSLADGMSPEEIAELNGASIHTVRTQIKQVMHKTRTSRQGELVACLHTSLASLAPAPTALDRLPRSRKLMIGTRALGYVDCGPRDGVPVLFMHSWARASSRLMTQAQFDSLAHWGIRIVEVERSGIGLTDPQVVDLNTWCEDVRCLADHLQLNGFDVMGYAGGAMYALACARNMPQRVKNITLLAPLSPADGKMQEPPKLALVKLMHLLARRMPKLLPALLKLWGSSLQRNPEAYLHSVISHLSAEDAKIFTEIVMPLDYVAQLQQAIQQGSDGLAEEQRLFMTNWSDLAKVEIPVHIWHGEHDSLVPIAYAEHLMKLLPNAALTRRADGGHYLMHYCWDEILADIHRRANERLLTEQMI